MPRQLQRDGQIVADDWQYLPPEGEGTDGAPAIAPVPAAQVPNTTSIIIPFERWQSERDQWLVHGGRLGVTLLPAHKVEALAPDLARFDLIAAEFPGPSDGRGYTQGRLLRERWKFTGELRATGYVRHDQLFFLARCGFNSFELPENELQSANAAFSTFSMEYQPSNDVGLALKPQHR